MVLDLFKNYSELNETMLHPKFLLLRDREMFVQQKKILLEWTKGFVDRDNKIVKEFQTSFHSSLWEFFLHALLLDSGFELDQSHSRPDFMVMAPHQINIEAVTSGIKQKGRPESTRDMSDILDNLTPPHLQHDYYSLLDEAIVRHSNAIRGKQQKYLKDYAHCEWIKPNVPFVLALGSYDQVNYGREFYYPLLALLYGFYYNAEENSFYKKTHITKSGSDADIPIGLFLDNSYKEISAIIFSCTVTLGKLTSLAVSRGADAFNKHQKVLTIRKDFQDFPYYKLHEVSVNNPELLDDGVMIFHNPNAEVKLSPDAFAHTNIVQFTFEDNSVNFLGNFPIVARLNISKYLYNGMADIFVDGMLTQFNYREQ
jgi:hypothetical protein